ncbi:MAG: hypothetical protein JWR51_4786, partial [Devosia sp.]|nr:hypothetical protein [Devosia sp.]
MSGTFSEIDENTYLGGLTLYDSIFKLGP